MDALPLHLPPHGLLQPSKVQQYSMISPLCIKRSAPLQKASSLRIDLKPLCHSSASSIRGELEALCSGLEAVC